MTGSWDNFRYDNNINPERLWNYEENLSEYQCPNPVNVTREG
jgi:hypothetical protein